MPDLKTLIYPSSSAYLFHPPIPSTRTSQDNRIRHDTSVTMLPQVFPSCRVCRIRPHPFHAPLPPAGPASPRNHGVQKHLPRSILCLPHLVCSNIRDESQFVVSPHSCHQSTCCGMSPNPPHLQSGSGKSFSSSTWQAAKENCEEAAEVAAEARKP